LHTLASISRSEAGLILSSFRAAIYGAFLFSNASKTLTQAQKILLKEMPLDVRTAIKQLDIEPDITIYACCPSCFALYPPTPASHLHSYPERCNNQSVSTASICGTALLKKKKHALGGLVPIKTFAKQSFDSWIGQLLSRPGLEEAMEGAWRSSADGVWTDIMQAPAIQQFRGPDNETLFSVQKDGSLHLVFSLFIDWFNPFGNKKAGKSHSVGAIYLACLNLPDGLRYKPENIYLAGVIPGPREPASDEINHFLRLIVDDLLTLWYRGIYLSRTWSRACGRMVRAAMIPLVCDLPALRKTGGFAGHSSRNICSFCRLQKDDISNLDRKSWTKRTWEQHLEIATRWKDAQTQKIRDEIYETHGIRWSELLCLPYWDPTRYALVDAMHNLYLGDLHHHCMEILGIDVKGKPTEDQHNSPHAPDEQAIWLQRVVDGIIAGSSSAVSSARKGYIVAVAELNDVLPDGKQTKKDYVDALLNWVSSYHIY
jgi:hypothetical protein